MTASVCCVCLQVLAVCTCTCASNVSLYRRTHVHPYLPGCTHQLVFIHMYVHKCLLHTQPISMNMDCHTNLHSRWWILCQHYKGRHRGLHPPPHPCCICANPLQCIKANCRYYCLGHLEDSFSCSTPLIQCLVSHTASQVKSAVSVNGMGYSTEHTSVPQFITKLLTSSFNYV